MKAKVKDTGEIVEVKFCTHIISLIPTVLNFLALEKQR